MNLRSFLLWRRVAGPLYVGAVIERGGVAHVSQGGAADPVLDEDAFAEQTGLRLSYPARTAVRRLLQEDVLLLDVRDLFNAGDLQYSNGRLVLDATIKASIRAERMAAVQKAVQVVNKELEQA